MTRIARKRLLLGGLALAVLVLVVYGFLPDPAPVAVAPVTRGPMERLVEEEGETQLADTFVISAPVTAFVRRIDLEPGDVLAEGQVVARLEPPRTPLLDPRTQAEAAARARAAQAAVTQAEQNARAAAAAAQQAAAEQGRTERLYADSAATAVALEQARATAAQAAAALDAAQAAVAAARAELAAARTALQRDASGTAGLAVAEQLRAPVAGQVLAVHHTSEGLVSAGTPLLTVGNPSGLEVRVDVLSQDAVQIAPGTPVRLAQWGGEAVLEASVVRVEPQGFTRVSSLGVEEKRVTVVAALTSPPALWAGLGAGYRVLARFVVWQGAGVLRVPTSALFRTGDGWAVFVVEDGRAVRREVMLGHQTGLLAEVRSGLAEGEAVIVHPESTLEPGTRVAARTE